MFWRARRTRAQWAKSGSEAVLLQSPRTLCTISTDCFAETPVTVSFDHIYHLEYKHEKVHASDDKSLKMNDATLILK